MTSKQLSFIEAINRAFIDEMESDPNVLFFGEDVSDHKRILGSAKHLVEQFGPDRCFSTPLSEDAMTGLALGMAVSGLRPIHNHIRVDFLILGLNQLINMISTMRYISCGELHVPLVIRALIGRGWGQGPQHSKSLQALFAHIPGLKVVMPTTPQDAYSLFRAAIQDNNPVIFLEHRWLHFAEDYVDFDKKIPLNKAQILRKGDDVTVVCTSWMNVEALRASEILAERGISLEIVDAKSIAPLDIDTIASSVRKTKRCLIADYDWSYCGFSAEISAQINKRCFSQLDTAVERIGFEHVPCPTTRPLENLFYPSAKTIIRKVELMLGLEKLDLSQESFFSYEQKFKGPF